MKTLKILSITMLLSLGFGFSPSKINCSSSCRACACECCETSDKNIDSGRVRAFVSTIELPFSKNKVISKDARFAGEIGTSGSSTFDFKIGYKELYMRDNQHLDLAIMAKNVKSFMFSEDSKFAYIEFEDGEKIIYDLYAKKEVTQLNSYAKYESNLHFCELDSFLSVHFFCGRLTFYDTLDGVIEIGKFKNVDRFYFSNNFIKSVVMDGEAYESNAYIAIFFKDGSIKLMKANRFEGGPCVCIFSYPRIELIEIVEFKSVEKNK